MSTTELLLMTSTLPSPLELPPLTSLPPEMLIEPPLDKLLLMTSPPIITRGPFVDSPPLVI